MRKLTNKKDEYIMWVFFLMGIGSLDLGSSRLLVALAWDGERRGLRVRPVLDPVLPTSVRHPPRLVVRRKDSLVKE
jgi:hypothetical protein